VNDTQLDPELVAAGSGKIIDAAEEALAKLPGVVGRIRDLEAEKPWGNDGAGQAFMEQYAPAIAGLEAAEKIVPLIEAVGQAIALGVASTVDVDVAARDRVVATNIANGLP
jgi:hypothetical protein